MTEQSTLLT